MIRGKVRTGGDRVRQGRVNAMSTIRRAGILAFCAAAFATGCGKAEIRTNCTMNGFGNGICQFTNSGDRPGSVCGRIVVQQTALTERHDSAALAKLRRLAAASSRAAAASSRESEEMGVPVGETRSWKEWENLRKEQEIVRNEAIANLPHVESELFCSGDVGSRETKRVDLMVVEVRDMCDPSDSDDSWGDVCAFNFVADS